MERNILTNRMTQQAREESDALENDRERERERERERVKGKKRRRKNIDKTTKVWLSWQRVMNYNG